MDKLQKITEKKIREFAGDVIFNRGLVYYMDDMVEDFELDPLNNSIHAYIHGTVGIYTIEVQQGSGHVEADCDCPYEGYPCKHIVAVLLYYFHNKESYIRSLDRAEKAEKSVKDRLISLNQNELVNIILRFVKQDPSFKSQLFLQLGIDNELVLKQFSRRIDKVFRAFDRDIFSPYEISRQLKEIIEEIQNADHEILVEVLWKITDGLLYQLSEYGMDDMGLENAAVEAMELLVQAINSTSKLEKRRAEIKEKLEEYCRQSNCGIVDDIDEAVFELSGKNKIHANN